MKQPIEILDSTLRDGAQAVSYTHLDVYKRQGLDQEVVEMLRANFNGECSEVGMYLAMARVAHREGYPEIGLYLSLIHISPSGLLSAYSD